MKKAYVQFSKKVVIAVCIAVTVLSTAGVVLGYLSGQMDQTTAIIRIYIQYAMVVFAAYSGNSAVQKWLIKRWGTESTKSDDKTETESNNG